MQGKGLLVLIDGKRNDIGSTADAYARAYLGKVPVGESFEPSWHADGLTVNPYLGSDGIAPFVKVAAREGKGIYALVRTSNASAGEFQDLVADGKAALPARGGTTGPMGRAPQGGVRLQLARCGGGGNLSEQLAELRATLPGIPFLVPGYGTQGGSSKDAAPAFDAEGLGAIINNSRGLTYAYSRPPPACQVRHAMASGHRRGGA